MTVRRHLPVGSGSTSSASAAPGLSGIARLLLARGVEVSGSDGAASPTLDALRDAGRDGARRPRPAAPRPPRRGRHRRRLDRGQAGQPRVRRGDRAPASPCCPRSAALAGADGGPPGRRGRRHARQDHDHLAADRRPAGRRRRPDVRDRRRPRRDRGQRRRGQRRPVRRRGRRERRRLPRLPAVRRDRHQRRGRPPRPLGDRRGLRRGVRRVRRPASTPRASWSAASTIPEPPRWPSGSARPAAGSSPSPPARGAAGRRSRARWPGVTLWSPGDHYLADALAALRRRRRPRVRPDATCARGIASYTGTRRRMEPKGEAGGVRVYDSYAHHPTEIAGDLAAARSLAGDGRLVVAFQPHLPSRTRVLGAAMGEALAPPTRWWCATSTWLARTPDPAVTGALVADAVPLPADAGRPSCPGSPTSPRSWSPGPGRATWSSPSARATSPRSARRCSRCWPTARGARRCLSPAAPRPPAAGGGSRAGSGGAAGSPGGTSSCWCSSWRCSAPASTRSGSRPGSTSRRST